MPLRRQVVTLLVMRAFGSVIVKLLGQARNAALVLFEVSRGNQQASGQQLVGYSVSLFFFSLYVRMRQKKLAPPKDAAALKPAKTE